MRSIFCNVPTFLNSSWSLWTHFVVFRDEMKGTGVEALEKFLFNYFQRPSRPVQPHAISSKCPPRPEEPISNKWLAMPCHRPNPATVTFPGDRASADWHPPVLSVSQILLKVSDGANMAARSMSAHSHSPLSSLLSLIRPRALGTKAGVCFFVGLFTWGVFLRVRVQVFDVQHANVRLRRPAYWPIRAFHKKACRARSWEEWNRRERRAVILSLSISLLQLIILARSFSAALIWANHLTWLWTFELRHTGYGIAPTLAQSSSETFPKSLF